MVWSVKYRRKIITKELSYKIAEEKGFIIHLVESREGDHMHYFVSAPPKLSITIILILPAIKIVGFFYR